MEVKTIRVSKVIVGKKRDNSSKIRKKTPIFKLASLTHSKKHFSLVK